MRKGRLKAKSRVIKASRAIDEFVISEKTIDISNIFVHQTMKLIKVSKVYLSMFGQVMWYDFDLFREREKEIDYFLLYDMHILYTEEFISLYIFTRNFSYY